MVICIAGMPTPRLAAASGSAGTNMCMAKVPLKVSMPSSQRGA